MLPLALALALAADPTVTAAWTRATPPGAKNGAAYLRIESPEDERLVGASCACAAKVEVHEMSMKGGVMSMKHLPEGAPIAKGAPLVLAPGGPHLMLLDLKSPLVEGSPVELTLRFERAKPVTVKLDVKPVGAKGP